MEVAYVAAAKADRVKERAPERLLSDSRQQKQWKRPIQGEIKINSDGAFFSSSGDGGWGFVLRDETGAVVKAGAGREDHLQDAFHAELMGCVSGLRTAAAVGIAVIQLETDASQVKRRLTVMITDYLLWGE